MPKRSVWANKRILMLAACPYPSPLGTAVCIRQLALEFAACGHTVHIVTYASSSAPGVVFDDGPTICHAVPGADIATRSGPQRAKFQADLRLWRYAKQLGSSVSFDLLWGHHAEGMALGWLLQHSLKLPLVGHVHSRLSLELPEYLMKYFHSDASKAGAERACHKLLRYASAFCGHACDRLLPQLVDALVTLSVADAAACAPYAPRGRTFVRYPELLPVPKAAAQYDPKCTCGASNGPYAIYSGNADPYQNLALLCDALRLQPQNCVLATHTQTTAFDAYPWPERTRIVRVDSFEQMQHWLQGASMGVCPRVQPCGYPIKWLNYWQAGLCLVAIEAVGRAVFGARMNTDVHGPTTWAGPSAGALGHAMLQNVSRPKSQSPWGPLTNTDSLECIMAEAKDNYTRYM